MNLSSRLKSCEVLRPDHMHTQIWVLVFFDPLKIIVTLFMFTRIVSHRASPLKMATRSASDFKSLFKSKWMY